MRKSKQNKIVKERMWEEPNLQVTYNDGIITVTWSEQIQKLLRLQKENIKLAAATLGTTVEDAKKMSLTESLDLSEILKFVAVLKGNVTVKIT